MPQRTPTQQNKNKQINKQYRITTTKELEYNKENRTVYGGGVPIGHFRK
jgi:hypothetical protein